VIPHAKPAESIEDLQENIFVNTVACSDPGVHRRATLIALNLAATPPIAEQTTVFFDSDAEGRPGPGGAGR
jgi:hypothetical protein